MKLIVGLGNIGKKYEDTRHNFGFMVLDQLAYKKKIVFKESSRFQGAFASETDSLHEKIYYLKPHTYMNLSGAAVQALAHYYKIDLQDILVVYDDMDLELGSLRFVRGGGAGGHKGMLSIMTVFGSQEIARLKLGVGKPKHPEHDVSDYVLEKFSSDEIKLVNNILGDAVQAVAVYLKEGLSKAMNKFNKIYKENLKPTSLKEK